MNNDKSTNGRKNIKNKSNLEILRKRLLEERNNITLDDLEKRTGISHSTLGAIETGKRDNPNIDILISLAKTYGCSIDYLVGLSDYKSSNIDDKEVCKRTGLSEIALLNLEKVVEEETSRDFINLFLESKYFEHYFELINDFIDIDYLDTNVINSYNSSFSLDNIDRIKLLDLENAMCKLKYCYEKNYIFCKEILVTTKFLIDTNKHEIRIIQAEDTNEERKQREISKNLEKIERYEKLVSDLVKRIDIYEQNKKENDNAKK